MSLHPLFAQVLKPFALKPPTAREQLDKLLRLPFEVDMSTDPYSECMVTPDEGIVLSAIDELIEAHIPELEDRIRELLIEQRDAAARDD